MINHRVSRWFSFFGRNHRWFTDSLRYYIWA
jgi:hypothetical protein